MDIEGIYATSILWSNINIEYTSPTQFLMLIPACLSMLTAIHILETYLFQPVGIYLGLKPDRPKRTQDNVLLEQFSQQSKTPSQDKTVVVSKEANLTPRQAASWLRRGKGDSKPSTLVKFCESLWKLLFYTSLWSFGLIRFWNDPWLWDIKECWVDFGKNNITSDMWWYGAITLTFYISMSIRLFKDTNRKDFVEMFVHHIISIIITLVSWISGIHRICIIFALLHDVSDIFMEAGKIAIYLKYRRTSDVFGILFLTVWFTTRTGLFPFWILRHCLEDATGTLRKHSIYYVFNGLSLGLLGLQLYWTYFIVRIAKKTYFGSKDTQFDDSSEEILKEE